jgi:AmmeMemoRadiSam system protein B
MQIRNYSLPLGWYPREGAAVSAFLSEFDNVKSACGAVIMPHAGWYYSGRTAALGAASLIKEAQTVVILGGHLGSGSAPLFAMEDAVKTPFGAMPIDTALRSAMFDEIDGEQDIYRDNTVEVLLPMAHYFFPEAKLLWLRLPADDSSYETGRILSQTAAKLNRKIKVIASTDLTHYGPNYRFTPHGVGEAALRWVREVNDADFIKAVESGSGKEVLRRAEKDFSSCSAGAVLGAMGFAEAEGFKKARLLEYATSADVNKEAEVPDSFVGYAAVAFDAK